MYRIMTSTYMECFIDSFSNYMPFISFYCFIALVRIFSTMSKDCSMDILTLFLILWEKHSGLHFQG